jgi:large subunit ribosomal protein L18
MMNRAQKKLQRRSRAHLRVRSRIAGSTDRPRLAIYKSSRYLYAQIIDDQKGETLVQANSREGEALGKIDGGAKTKSAARKVGELIGERARSKGIDSVVFDRGGYQYHGRVKEIAEGARAKGLRF